MMGFLSAIGLMLLYGLGLMIIILIVQVMAKNLYNRLLKKHGESSIFLKKLYEADGWNVFVVVVAIMIIFYALK